MNLMKQAPTVLKKLIANGFLSLLLPLMAAAPLHAYELAGWDVHGTFSQGWIHTRDGNFVENSNEGSFDFREFGINATRSLGDHVTVGGQLLGKVFGTVGKDKLYLDWLNVSYSPMNEFGVRVGKMRMHYGMFGSTRDVDSLRTQVLLPQGVYIESYRGSLEALWGVELFGSWYSEDLGTFSYAGQLGQSAINDETGELERLASFIDLQLYGAKDGDAGSFKLAWDSPSQKLRLHSTYSFAEYTVSGPTDAVLGIPGTFDSKMKEQYFWINSLQYYWQRYTLTAETMYSNIEPVFLVRDIDFPETPFITGFKSAYLNLDFRATNRLTLGLGFSSLELRQKIGSGPGISNSKDKNDDLYASVRFDLTPSVILKLEQHFNRGSIGLFPAENPSGLSDKWSMTMAKISFVF